MNREKAFPSNPVLDLETNRTVFRDGMDLRDWFAGQALVSLLGSAWSLNMYDATRRAYDIADLMMEAKDESRV